MENSYRMRFRVNASQIPSQPETKEPQPERTISPTPVSQKEPPPAPHVPVALKAARNQLLLAYHLNNQRHQQQGLPGQIEALQQDQNQYQEAAAQSLWLRWAGIQQHLQSLFLLRMREKALVMDQLAASATSAASAAGGERSYTPERFSPYDVPRKGRKDVQ